MKNQFVLISLVFILGCTNNDLPDEDLLFKNDDRNYPTSFKKISKTEIEKRQVEFEKGQVTFSEIDSFGFVGWSFNDNFETRKALYKTQFSNTTELITSVKLYLVEKSAFTGITDTSILVPRDIKLLFQDYGGDIVRADTTKFNHLGINFGTQKIDGVEIYNSLLTISATANGVHHVFGHWYPQVYIPQKDKVSAELAKSVLTGRRLIGYNGWGQELSHVITESDLEEHKKIIYPYINKNLLELRVCWEFTPSHWQIFIDTTTGQILLEQDIAFYTL